MFGYVWPRLATFGHIGPRLVMWLAMSGHVSNRYSWLNCTRRSSPSGHVWPRLALLRCVARCFKLPIPLFQAEQLCFRLLETALRSGTELTRAHYKWIREKRPKSLHHSHHHSHHYALLTSYPQLDTQPPSSRHLPSDARDEADAYIAPSQLLCLLKCPTRLAGFCTNSSSSCAQTARSLSATL